MYYRDIPRTVRAEITPQRNGKNLSTDKALCSGFSLIVSTPEGMVEAVTVRTWMGRSSSASVVYATIWVYGDKGCSGHGQAGGYGYHKQSEAIARACDSAGIKLFGNPYYGRGHIPPGHLSAPFDFGGTGDSAYPEIFQAIARAAGFEGPGILISHA